MNHGDFNTFEVYGLCFVIATVSVSLISLVLSQLFGFSVLLFIILFIALLILSAELRNANLKYKRGGIINNKSEIIVFFLLILILYKLIRLFLFSINGEIIKSVSSNMMMEFTLISSMKNGINNRRGMIFGIRNPLVEGIIMRSGVITSAFSTLMSIGGADTEGAICLTFAILFLSVFHLQYSLTYRYTNSKVLSYLSVPTLFLIGGFGFVNYINNNDRNNPSIDYIYDLGSSGMNNWGHPTLHCFLSSPTSLLCAALSISCFLFYEIGLYKHGGVFVIISCIVCSKFGFVQLVFYFYVNWKQSKYGLRNVLLPSICFLLVSGFRFSITKPIWDYGLSFQSIIPFIYHIASVFGVLIVFIFVGCLTKMNYNMIGFIFVVYYVFGYISFQNEIRYNFLVYFPALFPILIAIAMDGVQSIISKISLDELRGSIKVICGFLFVTMWLSSIAGIYQQYGNNVIMYEIDETEISEWITYNTPKNSFVYSPVSISWNPAAILSGRQLYTVHNSYLPELLYKLEWMNERYSVLNLSSQIVQKANYILVKIDGEWFNVIDNEIGKLFQLEFSNDKYMLVSLVKK